jgi:NTP pyrophosphatase (non-canonical NTP hydrolase)
LTFNEYQTWTDKTARYDGKTTISGLNYVTLGLCGEAGEVANKVKKIHRDSGGILSEEVRQKLIDESSDVMWYLARLATELGVTLESVADYNVAKLEGRRERGTLSGSGDNR